MSLPCDALVKASVAFMVMMMVICFVVDWSDLCVTELYVGLSAVCLSLGGGGGGPVVQIRVVQKFIFGKNINFVKRALGKSNLCLSNCLKIFFFFLLSVNLCIY